MILTGAGISAESGIATFRDSNGLWENHSVEDVATPQGFRKDPHLVHRFYNERRKQMKSVHPNKAHKALVELEQAWDGDFLLVTQNIDNLHDLAGSKNLIHMHGELNKIICYSCGHKIEHTEDLSTDMVCPSCQVLGQMRPDVVWFGESPYQMGNIYAGLVMADIFVSIGTSGMVYPAAGFAETVYHNGRNASIIEINPDPCGNGFFNREIKDKATIGVRKLVAELLK